MFPHIDSFFIIFSRVTEVTFLLAIFIDYLFCDCDHPLVLYLKLKTDNVSVVNNYILFQSM